MEEKLKMLGRWIEFYEATAERLKTRGKMDQMAENFDTSAGNLKIAIANLKSGKVKFEELPEWISYRAKNEPPS